MTYVEKLQAWFEDQKANHGLVDMKFFPRYINFPGMEHPVKIDDGPDPTLEEMAECVYKLVTGEIPTTAVDVSELDL